MRSPASSARAVAAIAFLAVSAQLVSAQNMAFNKTVWVSSVLAPYNGSLAVDEIFSSASRWVSDATLNHTLVVDLDDV
jgi:hypothetical protein